MKQLVGVDRVGGRLGLFREKASFDEAHDEMLAITDPQDAYELHMNLIRHGREVCRPRPHCDECAPTGGGGVKLSAPPGQ